ncbi:MAG: hypothetical protein HYZ50_20810 [Deltaproteobacteria bacterium]|nr:hypothetical protein [Deltaproteobacteria bacterium]
MPIFLIHVVSILTTLVVLQQIPDRGTWLALLHSLGLAHYLASLIYARKQVVEFARQPDLFVPLFSILMIGAGVYLSRFPLLIYFAFHHAFNTAYMLNRTLPADNPNVRAFRGCVVLLHLFLYFFLLRAGAALEIGRSNPFAFLALQRSSLPATALLAGLTICYGGFFYYLYRLRSVLTRQTLIENCSLELLGLGAVAASFYLNFSFMAVVFYHFVFWALFPLLKMYELGVGKLASYVGVTVLSLAVFLLLSPIGMFSFLFPPLLFRQQFYLWSYLHITTSFVLSNAHPQWIVQLFRPSFAGGTAVQRA